MSMSDEEIKIIERNKLAKAIIKEFFNYIDLSLGKSLRRKLVYILIALLIVGGITTGIIHLPKGISG